MKANCQKNRKARYIWQPKKSRKTNVIETLGFTCYDLIRCSKPPYAI